MKNYVGNKSRKKYGSEIIRLKRKIIYMYYIRKKKIRYILEQKIRNIDIGKIQHGMVLYDMLWKQDGIRKKQVK